MEVIYLNANSIKLFEELALGTWERVRDGEILGCRQGEETITDLNLLEIKRAKLPDVTVKKGMNEDKTGIDWEWWIGSNTFGWWRYAIQAKKISKKGSYTELRHIVDGNYQIDILEKYAKSNYSIPLYCFYNHIELDDYSNSWNCNLRIEKEQLGCTIVPLDHVKKHHKKGKSKKFIDLHSDNRALPWRCIVKCPLMFHSYSSKINPLAKDGDNYKLYKTNSEDLFFYKNDEMIMNPELYNREVDILPKKILVISLGD